MLTELGKKVGKRPGQLVNDNNNERTSHIPYELLEFVRRDTYSLLIKGYAGVGKTTLSLTILRTLKIRDNFFYISTRLSPTQLFNYYPWLGISTNQDESSMVESPPQRMGYNISSFEDARLDEPESLFERITNQLMDVKAPIIIIDSWDAIASFMDKEARLNNERVLQTWRERAGAKLIFISENPSDTTLDFLVDGIVELGQRIQYGMRLREIALIKLRGIQIDRSSYLYTLNKGMFQSFNPYVPTDFAISDLYDHNEVNRAKITRRGQTGYNLSRVRDHYITSGYKQLDEALGGGFPRRGLVLLEMQSNINPRVCLTLLAGTISNVLRNDNPVLIEPFMGIDEKSILSYLRPYSEQKRDLVKIYLPSDACKDPSNHTKSQYQNLEVQCFCDTIVRARRDYQSKLLVNIMGISMCSKIHRYQEENQTDLISFISSTADLTMVAVTRHHGTELNLSEVADVQLRLIRVRGTLVLQSVIPETVSYAVVADKCSGRPAVKLESLV